ncbi:Mur ligase family protein [Pseudonocardia sp. GCM10023141]|uniref:Mur ligase family protein n=1 Tax=Pseudonocardia sp. GCM10023141 TaxID=3252653 RepID=UPI0036199110
MPRRKLGTRARAAWSDVAVRAGLGTSWLSPKLGLGGGSIIGGRVTLALDRGALARLAVGRRIVLVSGTNGKTTTSHLLAAALRTAGPVAHNSSGANMPDGAVAALSAARDAKLAVIEVDELHVAEVAEAVDPVAIVLLNLSRDQLDRGNEVRSVAKALSQALAHHPETTVIANADDPMVVWAALPAAHVVWVAAGVGWTGDVTTCPQCGRTLAVGDGHWACECGLARPQPTWSAEDGAAVTGGTRTPVALNLPGRFNLGNAVMAMAGAAVAGVEPAAAAAAMGAVQEVAGRYSTVWHGRHELRLLLAKNPAGWAETLGLLDEARPLLVMINAREADGRDTSWLWDVPFEELGPRPVAAAGERSPDIGLRLSYAGIEHTTVADPLGAIAALPPGKVDVVANYTAFHQLQRRLAAAAGNGESRA